MARPAVRLREISERMGDDRRIAVFGYARMTVAIGERWPGGRRRGDSESRLARRLGRGNRRVIHG